MIIKILDNDGIKFAQEIKMKVVYLAEDISRNYSFGLTQSKPNKLNDLLWLKVLPTKVKSFVSNSLLSFPANVLLPSLGKEY